MLNKYLGGLMSGLTAKVFRTYNASSTLQDQLGEMTKETSDIHEKLLFYNKANRAVAILCNHQKDKKREDIRKCKLELKTLKKDTAPEQLKEQLKKLSMNIKDKEDNKQVALGTSKLNYLDPRISIAWCQRNKVPIEKIYNKTQREKFQWALDMTKPDFTF